MSKFLNIETNFFLEPILKDVKFDKPIAIVIPWRETPSRITLFNYLVEWYSREFPLFKIIVSDSGHEKFNVASSRNLGIKKSFDEGHEVVICSDADVFVSKDSIIKSLLNAISTNNITIPYTELRKINEGGTQKFLKNDSQSFEMIEMKRKVPVLTKEKLQNLTPCAGIMIITKSLFYEFGGFDENYSGWGLEDTDYHKRYLDKYGRLFDYVEGFCLSLYHSRKEWENTDNRNLILFKSKHGSDYIL